METPAFAHMAELVDALASGASELMLVKVQVLLCVPGIIFDGCYLVASSTSVV